MPFVLCLISDLVLPLVECLLLATDSVCGTPSCLFIMHWAPVSWMYNAQPRNFATYFDDLVQSFGIQWLFFHFLKHIYDMVLNEAQESLYFYIQVVYG